MPVDREASGSLCIDFVNALPVPHIAISTLGAPFEIETICASDDVAAYLDETQLDSGVGPCWRARDTASPVLLPDLRQDAPTAWPVFLAAAARHGISSVYAFPMAVGLVDVGVVNLYATGVHALTVDQVDEAARLADSAGQRILRTALDGLDGLDDDSSTNASPRRFVHQATGMVVAQLRVAPDDALLVIRAHAFASGRSVREVAEAIISRDIDFSV
ncbi:GAF and ANTAR domain-containing protein [uncultured Microbacterium sp.]|uniref:GAF and ANTAR domain-containing protein n=1 Tax=uncultured Microbacterium sp. TaxID=191216 RepID=UPI0028CFD76C|nr:GAF and ANTAR domain-containing protein [uncultured Microbacterium sp.]